MGGELFRQLQDSDLGYVIGAFMAFVVFFSCESNRVNTAKHFILFFRWNIQMVKAARKKRMRKSDHMKKQLQHEKHN